MFRTIGTAIMLGVSLLPVAMAAQDAPAARAHWQPALSVGAWTDYGSAGDPGEPILGYQLALDVRRINPARRLNMLASFRGYTRDRANDLYEAGRLPAGEYSRRDNLLLAGLGADWALTTGPREWTLGATASAATSYETIREVTATGVPVNARYGNGSGWSRPTAALSLRTAVTLPVARSWGLRLGVEAFEFVERLDDVGPKVGMTIGWVPRR